MVWYISDFFTLDDEQEEWLEDAVERNIEWHRRDQLPKYARLLREINTEATTGVLTLEMMERHHTQFLVLWDEFIVQTAPDVTAFFMTLSDEQIDEFIENLEESNQELWEEFAGQTPEERRKSRQDSAIKGLKRVFGRLSDDQEALVRSYLSSMYDVSLEWMASRRQWQRDFHDLVIERPPEPEFSERMISMMLEPNNNDNPEYRRRVDANRRTMMSMMIALEAELTDKQRARFSNSLMKFSRNFEILAIEET